MPEAVDWETPRKLPSPTAVEEVSMNPDRHSLPEEERLLRDKDLREASTDQLYDLVMHLNLALQSRGEPGIVVRG